MAEVRSRARTVSLPSATLRMGQQLASEPTDALPFADGKVEGKGEAVPNRMGRRSQCDIEAVALWIMQSAKG